VIGAITKFACRITDDGGEAWDINPLEVSWWGIAVRLQTRGGGAAALGMFLAGRHGDRSSEEGDGGSGSRDGDGGEFHGAVCCCCSSSSSSSSFVDRLL